MRPAVPSTRLRKDRGDKERGLLAAAQARSPRREQAVARVAQGRSSAHQLGPQGGRGRGSRRGGAAPRPDRVAQLVGARGAATGSRHGEAHGEQRPRATRLTSVGAAQATSRSLHSASSPYTERRPVGVMGADKTLGPLLLLQVAAEPGPKPDLLARREEGSVPEGGGDRESRTSP